MPFAKGSKPKRAIVYSNEQKTDTIIWLALLKNHEAVRAAFRKKYGNKGYLPGGSKGPSDETMDDWAEKIRGQGSFAPRPRMRTK